MTETTLWPGQSTTNDAAITSTLTALTRKTIWEHVSDLPLRFDADHPQGMVRVDGVWWISSVDIDNGRGYILAVDSRGELVAKVPVGDDVRYHPGGMDFDGTALWIPSAEYRPDSTAAIYRMELDGTPERAFGFDDHVGGVARCGPDGDLVGWSWGSREFFRWNITGDLLGTRTNPAFFVDHQDCQYLDTGHMLCGGVSEINLHAGRGQLGGLGLLNVSTLIMEREVPFQFYSAGPSARTATENPIFAEVEDGHLVIHLLPEDHAGTIVTYRTPLV